MKKRLYDLLDMYTYDLSRSEHGELLINAKRLAPNRNKVEMLFSGPGVKSVASAKNEIERRWKNATYLNPDDFELDEIRGR